MIETKKLIEIADVIDSLHQTPEYVEEGIPMVRVTDVKPGDLLLDGCQFVTEDVFEKFTANHVPHKGDIVISRVGTYGNFAYVADDIKFCLGQNTSIIAPRINSRYLYYFLQSPFTRRQIESRVVGSTQKTLSLKNIKELEVPCPDEVTQKKIANVLETIDLKIANNNRINRNLLEQSFTIFHSMFDEKICESDMVEFGNVASFKYGTMPKKDKICEEGYPLFSGYKIVGYYPEKMFDEPQLIIVARGVGGTGDIKYTPENCYLTNLAIAIMANKKVYEEYLYHYLMCQDMKILNTGSAQPQITVSSLEKYKLYYPDEKAAKEFSDIVIPIRDRIRANRKENQKLEELRDSLLPKLMSGELDVSDLDI